MNATIRGTWRLAAMMIALFSAISSTLGVDTITTRSATAGNPSGGWSDTAIWSAGQVPTNIGAMTWHVIFPNGVPITQVDGDYTINRLDMSGAITESLDAGHLLTVVNQLNVNGGIFRGPGMTLTQGQTTWASNAQINNNHVLQNSGAFSVVDFLTVQSGGLFENLAAGVVTLQSDSGTRAIGGTNRNAGTYNLSVTGQFGLVSVSEMETTASGVVNVLSGPVSLTNPRQQAGTFNIANIAAISFANNNFGFTSVFTSASSLQAAAGSSVTLSGLGRLRIEGEFDAVGSVTALAQEVEWTTVPANIGQSFTAGGGIARFSGGMPAMNNLAVTGGTLTGVGDHQITSTFTASGTGVLGGMGTSTLTSGGSASGNLTIDQRKLVIGAGAGSTLSATLSNNGELQNLGTVTNADFLRAAASTGTFRNDATYNVTSNLHRVDAAFAGSGTTTIANGASLAIDGVASGAQQFVVNGALNFGSTNPFVPVGTRTFDAASSVTGAGSVAFGFGTTNIGGNFAVGGPVTVAGGTANFTSAVNTISALRAGFPLAAGGTFNFNGGLAQVGTLQLGFSGFVNITGNTTVTGTADFLGGTHGGSGITAVQGPARLGGMTFNGRQVDFQNTVVPASGGFSLTNNATIRIAPGAGRYDLDGFNVNVSGSGVTPGQFVNAGVIDNTHPSFPNDTFLFRVDVPFVLEATGRIENGHDLQFTRNVNAAGEVVLTRPEAQLLLQAAGPGIVQTFTGPVSGPGSIFIGGPPAPPGNLMRVNFDGGLDLSGVTSELNINNADMTVTFDAPVNPSSFQPDSIYIYSTGPPGTNGSSFRALATRRLDFAAFRAGANVVGIKKQALISSDDPDRQLTFEVTESMSFDGTGAGTNVTLVTLENIKFKISTVNPVNQIGPVNLTLNNSSVILGGRWTLTDDITIRGTPAPDSIVVIEGEDAFLDVNADGVLDAIDYGVFVRAGGEVTIRGGVIAELHAEAGGEISTGPTPGTATIGGSLTLSDTGTMSAKLGGTQQGVTYDFFNVDGPFALNGGVLDLTFTNGFQLQVQPSDVFTLLQSTLPITGSFTNIPNGGQLPASDGRGVFTIYYGSASPYLPNMLIATNFVPEPSAAALIVFGAALSVGRRRRR